ncbi:MAG: HNH endonuclease [Pseudomonadota bacterium]
MHVDQTALTQGAGRSDLPVETVKRLTCDGSIVPMFENAEGEPLSVGRKQRTITTAIRRALESRDGGCTFPGCNHKRFVDAHHVMHWAEGGSTSVDNLLLLCDRHHRLVHEGRFLIRKDRQGKWYFCRPDGRAIPGCGYQLEDMLDDEIGSVSQERAAWEDAGRWLATNAAGSP